MKMFLGIAKDYEVLGVSIHSEADGLLLKVRLPDFDASEIRAIRWKQAETGFITAEELMRVQKAGYNRPKEVPLKRQSVRQRIFTA